MSATPSSAIRIMELFIHGYLWVCICLINMTIGEWLLRRGDPGLKGEKKNREREICHPERDTRWSQKEPSPECFAGLETLLSQMWNPSRSLILKDVGVHTGDKA